MTARVVDDGWIRTHDDALALLRYAVPGARVGLAPVRLDSRRTAQAARRYEITVHALGREPVTTGDLYHLPLRAEPLARRAREIADRALAVCHSPL